MQRIAMHRTRLRWFTLCIILFLVVHVAGEDDKSVCSTVVQCRRKDVGTVCDRNVEECPPCVNLLDDTITCWEKDPATKLCQFAGEKYDCTDVWHSEGILTYPPSVLANKTETPYVKTKSTSTTATSSNSKYILYGAIGGGVLFILVLAVFFIRRRRQQNMQTQKFSAHDTPTFIMEKNEYDLSQHEEVSVLGDPLPSQRSRGGGGEKKKTRFDMVDRYTTEKIVSDVAARVTQAHTNVFDEYLRMKKEMKFDEQSERGTQVSSVSMMESELGSVTGHNTRSDSECFSEMTYNDEKYSFSEDVVIARDREIEI